ncbi:MAG: hypothetical protein AAGA50_04190 [Pseudomonadota bacterium]
MAHSLFEPAPPPLGEKLWRRMKELNLGLPAKELRKNSLSEQSETAGTSQPEQLDARGRQQYLLAALTVDPIKK